MCRGRLIDGGGVCRRRGRVSERGFWEINLSEGTGTAASEDSEMEESMLLKATLGGYTETKYVTSSAILFSRNINCLPGPLRQCVPSINEL